MTKSSDKLLPCPFCGGEAKEMVGVRDDHGFAIMCGRAFCKVRTRGHPTVEQARRAWNTRTGNQP